MTLYIQNGCYSKLLASSPGSTQFFSLGHWVSNIDKVGGAWRRGYQIAVSSLKSDQSRGGAVGGSGNESVISFTVDEKGPTHAVMEYRWIFEQHLYHSTCLRSYVHNYHVVDYILNIGHACGLPRNEITSGGLADLSPKLAPTQITHYTVLQVSLLILNHSNTWSFAQFIITGTVSTQTFIY